MFDRLGRNCRAIVKSVMRPLAQASSQCVRICSKYWAARPRPGRLAGPHPHAGLARTHDGLGPVGDIQLIEDAIDMIANGFWAYRQVACNRCIVEAASDQFEDLTLALCKFGKRLSLRKPRPDPDRARSGRSRPRTVSTPAGAPTGCDCGSQAERIPRQAIELATMRPSPNGTRASFRACNTSVGQLTFGNRSVTSIASNPRISPTAFSGEVDMRWRSVNQRNCSGVLSGMNIVV